MKPVTLIPILFALGTVALSAADAPGTQTRYIPVVINKSAAIDSAQEITRVSTSNPAVADYVLVSNKELLVHGKGLGSASVVVWSKGGTRTFYDISVEPDIESLETLVRATFPGETIKLHAARDSISLSGNVSSKEVSDRAVALLGPSAKSVVNNLNLPVPPVDKQILLRVRFAELDRTMLKNLGVNLFSTGAGNTVGLTTTGQFSPPRASDVRGVIGAPTEGTTSTFSLSDALNILAFRPDLNLGATIKAMQNDGLLQILAEPNLVTTNGKEASFLVGGEFPVPVLQGGANAGSVTVQFREFGIRLTFLPTLTLNGTLKMHVKPEVSTIDMANAVTMGGYTIPALSTRRIDSTIELAPGQSFVIGGLVDDRVTESLMKVPGLANIPLIGYLFKSRSENRTKTELLIIVTPEAVEPLNPGDPLLKIPMPRKLMEPQMDPKAPPPPAATTDKKTDKKNDKKKK